jgi:dTDP-glucose pyrophosphorylase
VTPHTNLFADLVLDAGKNIRDAMKLLNTNAREVVLVKDAESQICGLITDGDIRRGLLNGATLDSPVSAIMHRDFFAVGPEIDRAAVLDIMKARQFQHVPVLDREGRLLAVHFLRDLIGAAPKPNVAVVMAGGKGTRLWPVTETVPKPMVEVAGRPILERVILHLISHGIRHIYLAVNYRAKIIEQYFADGTALGCKLEYVRETMPLGTAGALSLLSLRPAHPFFVLNGDLVTDVDLTAMLDVHVQNRNSATMGVGSYQVQIPFGAVTEKNGQLLSIDEKPTVNFLVNRGIYILDPSSLDHVPKNTEFPMTALFRALLDAKQCVGIYEFQNYWHDVGFPEDLRRVRGHA